MHLALANPAGAGEPFHDTCVDRVRHSERCFDKLGTNGVGDARTMIGEPE